MASGDRFYELQLCHRPAFWGDIGSLLKIEGLVVGGEGARAILMLPSVDAGALKLESYWDVDMLPKTYELTADQWSEWLRLSDNPDVLVMPAKAFHRKLRYEISGAVQQKIWVADGFKCMFCGVAMGKAQLTIDHWEPLETGGENDASNFISACRACNKAKGSMPARDWCSLRKLDYNFFVEYLKTRKLP